MTLSAAAIRMMAEKGLSALDIADIAEANEPARSSAAVRQKRYRDSKKRNERDLTRDVTPPPIESILTPSVPQSPDGDCPPLAEKVVSAWNAMAGANGLSPARRLNPGRIKHLTARVREHGESAIFEAIDKLGQSDWHCGRKPGSDWKADLGWLLKSPENFQKILERDDVTASAKRADPAALAAFEQRRDAFAAIEQRWERGEFESRAEYHRARDAVLAGETPSPRTSATGPPRPIAALIPETLRLAANA